MDIEQRTETLTAAYIHSYNLALKEVNNPNFAAQIAMAVIMVINTNIPEKPAVTHLVAFFAQLAAQKPEPGEKEESNHDGAENAAD